MVPDIHIHASISIKERGGVAIDDGGIYSRMVLTMLEADFHLVCLCGKHAPKPVVELLVVFGDVEPCRKWTYVLASRVFLPLRLSSKFLVVC